MTTEQAMILIATRARGLGWVVLFNRSNTTSSRYIRLQRTDDPRSGILEIRIADHRAPGYQNGGYHFRGRTTYDLRPYNRAYVIDRMNRLFTRLGEKL